MLQRIKWCCWMWVSGAARTLRCVCTTIGDEACLYYGVCSVQHALCMQAWRIGKLGGADTSNGTVTMLDTEVHTCCCIAQPACVVAACCWRCGCRSDLGHAEGSGGETAASLSVFGCLDACTHPAMQGQCAIVVGVTLAMPRVKGPRRLQAARCV